MSNLFEIWILGSFIVGGALMCWFNTGLATHILSVIRVLGWKRNDDDYWSDNELIGGESYRTELKLFSKINADNWMEDKLPKLVAELLMCPGCLSVHLGFWCSLVFFLTMPLTLPQALVLWLCLPASSNMILKFIQR